MKDHDNDDEEEEDTTEKCTDGVDSFRPSKLRRILQSPLDHPMTTIQDSIVFEQVQCRMQDFVRMMMPSSRYTPDMDEFARNCTDLLQNYTGHHHDAEGNDLTTTTTTTSSSSSMWEQLHGLLLLWLDYKITSCTPLDITTDDYRAVQSQLVVTTTCTCRCLLQVYRCCSPQQQRTPPRLCTMESLQLLVRTFLRIHSNHEPTTTSTMTLMDWKGIAPLLRVIEMTIQQVDTRQLSCYTQLRFLLCLVQVATTTTTTIMTTLDHSCTDDSLGLASSTAHNILQRLGTGVMVTGLGWDPLRSYAEVAMQVVSDPNPSWGTMSSTTTSIQVFQIQCLLQRSSSTLHPEIVVVDIVPILVDKIFENCKGHSLNDLSQIQALDCIVTLASRYNQSSSTTTTLGDASYTALLEAFLHVLTEFESKADFELYLKGKATEGLQYLLELEDSLPHCIHCLLLGSNKDTYKIKRFLSSLLDVSQIIHSQRTYGKECDDNFIVDTSIFPMNSFVMAASEIVLSTLCWSLQQIDSNGMFLPLSYVVSVCDKFLQHNRCTNQHILYLTVHMICREQKTVFFSIVQTYPELLSALVSLLKVDEDDHTGVTTKRLILTFFQDLLSTCPLFKTVVARQMGVVEAITYVADISLRQENENRSCHSLQEIAVQLLFVLSSDVFNRRIMARQSHVLPSMIRFVRGSRRDILTSESTNNTTSRTDNSSHHRETMKRCIAQLVAVL
jgi:hypothetical protein